MLSGFAKGQEKAAAKSLQKFWLDAANSTLYKNWWGGVITGLFTKGGIYDSTPLKEFLNKELPKELSFKRHMNFGIVNVLTGQYVDFD